MRILKLRAAYGWSATQTAKRFLVTEETIASWVRRVDERGERLGTSRASDSHLRYRGSVSTVRQPAIAHSE